jgi:uncharacterized protein YdcH (DUF465 family)
MFGEPHDIPHEFPEYRDVIKTLHDNNSQFQQLYSEYHELDREIHDIELNVEPVSDFYAEDLKKKRVHLKDEIYTMLRAHCVTTAAVAY